MSRYKNQNVSAFCLKVFLYANIVALCMLNDTWSLQKLKRRIKAK